MGALQPFLENVRRLELKLGQIPAIALTAAARNEDRARDPVVGNISLHLFISEHTVQERNHTVPWIWIRRPRKKSIVSLMLE
jgi:hypothetical protein